MTFYGFFTSCLNTSKEKYEELLKKPRARCNIFADEIKEIIEKVKKQN